MRTGCLVSAIALLLFVSPFCTAAGVYKWVDDQGRVHYGDRPPAGSSEPGQVSITPAPAVDPGTTQRNERRKRLLDTLATEREQRQAQSAKERAQRLELRRRCATARRRLELFERANLLYRKGKDGSRTYLNDADREATISALRDGIARNCKGG